MTEIVYTAQSTGFRRGVKYSNPRYFNGPKAWATSVVLVGDWPEVSAAYEAAGIPVRTVPLDGWEGAWPPAEEPPPPMASKEPVKPATDPEAEADKTEVEYGNYGEWFVTRGGERIAGPFESRAKARRAMQGNDA